MSYYPTSTSGTAVKNLTRRGKGRPRGAKDKVNRTIKLALSESFHELGGKSWLVKLGKEDPKTYALLLARLIPAEVQAEITADVTHGLEQNLAARISEGRERVKLLNRERRREIVDNAAHANVGDDDGIS